MRPLLFLIGSVAGFLTLSRRYRKPPAEAPAPGPGGPGTIQPVERGTPVIVGDGSFWVSSPRIDDGGSWHRTAQQLRSCVVGAQLTDAVLEVNGAPERLPEWDGDSVVAVVYNGISALTLGTPETDDRRINIVWTDAHGNGFTRGSAWRAEPDRLTFESVAHAGGRITKIAIDGRTVYRAREHDKAGQRARCELRLLYQFRAVEPIV